MEKNEENKYDDRKRDQAYTDIAILTSTLLEMSKRLSDQAANIQVLNDSHISTQVKLTEIIGEHKALSYRLDVLEKSWKSNLTTGLSISTFVLGLIIFIINYLLN